MVINKFIGAFSITAACLFSDVICAADVSTDISWMVGRFEGKFFQGRGNQVFSVSCGSDRSCELVRGWDRTIYKDVFPAEAPTKRANQALKHARQMFSSGMKLAPDEAATTDLVRPLLQSGLEVQQCTGLSDNFYILCKTPSGLWKEQTILLFGRVITAGLNKRNADGSANCDGTETPFCGYVPVLLHKNN